MRNLPSKGCPFNKYELSDDEMEALVKEQYGERTGEVIELFKKSYPDKKVVDLLSIDRLVRAPSKAPGQGPCQAG